MLGVAENARLENAEMENPAPNHRGGKPVSYTHLTLPTNREV